MKQNIIELGLVRVSELEFAYSGGGKVPDWEKQSDEEAEPYISTW